MCMSWPLTNKSHQPGHQMTNRERPVGPGWNPSFSGLDTEVNHINKLTVGPRCDAKSAARERREPERITVHVLPLQLAEACASGGISSMVTITLGEGGPGEQETVNKERRTAGGDQEEGSERKMSYMIWLLEKPLWPLLLLPLFQGPIYRINYHIPHWVRNCEQQRTEVQETQVPSLPSFHLCDHENR